MTLDHSDLEEVTSDARRLASEERARNPSSFKRRAVVGAADSDEEDRLVGGDEDLQIWKLLPHLKELPEAMFKKLPLSAMFQLNSAIAKEQKSTAKMNTNWQRMRRSWQQTQRRSREA